MLTDQEIYNSIKGRPSEYVFKGKSVLELSPWTELIAGALATETEVGTVEQAIEHELALASEKKRSAFQLLTQELVKFGEPLSPSLAARMTLCTIAHRYAYEIIEYPLLFGTSDLDLSYRNAPGYRSRAYGRGDGSKQSSIMRTLRPVDATLAKALLIGLDKFDIRYGIAYLYAIRESIYLTGKVRRAPWPPDYFTYLQKILAPQTDTTWLYGLDTTPLGYAQAPITPASSDWQHSTRSIKSSA